MVSRKRIGIFLIIVLLAILILIITNVIPIKISGFAVSQNDVAQKVKSLYELANPGTAIEIVAVTEQSGLYKIVLKATDSSGTTYREAFVTKDGELLTENVILVQESTQQMEKMKSFVDCLAGKGVRIFGLNNQTATLMQFNILGRYSAKLFISCDGDLVQNCIANNVTYAPSVLAGNYIYPGVKTVDWFEQASGCTF
jgi:hypothetical protein